MAQLKPTLQPTSSHPQPPTPQLATQSPIATVRMFTGWTIFFLVILRIFIGWHFFIEGVYKLCQPDWRATSYLVASAGPMRPLFRAMIKDVDGREALALDSPGITNGTELTGDKAAALKTALSARLKAELDAMLADVVKYYGLDTNQENLARNICAGQQLKITQLLDGNDPKAENKDFISQVWDYGVLLEEITAQEAKAKTTFEIQRLQDMYRSKAEKKNKLIGAAYKHINDLPVLVYKDLGPDKKGLLNETQLAKGYMKTDVSPTWWIDWANMIALTAVGVCLILGLFTRLACLGAAGLLAMYYCAMPALPGIPESPALEGHYLIINKNLIELVTVLMLATTRVGRWGGLDGLIARKAKPAI